LSGLFGFLVDLQKVALVLKSWHGLPDSSACQSCLRSAVEHTIDLTDGGLVHPGRPMLDPARCISTIGTTPALEPVPSILDAVDRPVGEELAEIRPFRSQFEILLE
jgi:hypothetical protein